LKHFIVHIFSTKTSLSEFRCSTCWICCR